MPNVVAHSEFPCPSCGGQVEWSAARKARVCAHCGTASFDDPAPAPSTFSAQTGLPPSVITGFAQSPLGKLAGRLTDQQQDPGSFVRGLRDISADAKKSGVFSALGSIAKAIWWLFLLGFAVLAVLCVVGAIVGRGAGVLWIPAGVFALLACIMLSASAKK